ncbi:MAG TPA: lysine-sensitive aspartokinase 3 [Longimicrobiaceae bacterium]|nr:lysine-sensitive aspartokinase 3 [Longimicrobiaceae bacterium]
MRPVVLKFGGTSVEDSAAMGRLAGIVGERLSAAPVVVVSALRGVTDALLQGVRFATEGDPEGGMAQLDPQLDRHLRIAGEMLDTREAAEIEGAVEAARGEIRNLLRIVRAHPGTRLPLQDEIVSYGERLSAQLSAAVLRAAGVPGVHADARRCIRTNEEHTAAVPIPEPTRGHTRAELGPILADGGVAVLGGFIASAESGATTTLGRGGSDYSAAIIGAALDASEIQIWTDVTGFLTADPRVVPNAQPLARLSYHEAAELAFFGAKVLHPKTIQPAVETRIPVRICNSRLPHLPGTLITEDAEPARPGVKAIAHKSGISLVQVTSTRMLGAYGFLRALFEVFDRHRTGVDVVSTSEVSVSLSLEDTRRLPDVLRDLEALGSVRVSHGNAIVCIVGEGIGSLPGVAARVFGTIADINVVLISQGASSINLTFVVSQEEVETAVQRLHDTFFPNRS